MRLDLVGQAMREQVEDIKAAQLKIFVRRGGPQVLALTGSRLNNLHSTSVSLS